MSDPFEGLPRGHFAAILADPPWAFEAWSGETRVMKRGSKTTYLAARAHYDTLSIDELGALPIEELAAEDCCLFIWITWPNLVGAVQTIDSWGFKYKTCAFNWMKGHAGQIELFQEEVTPLMKMGYWTRASSEVCLLATRGKPKRINADVRQGIIAPIRQHSRKPDCVHERIERLVAGPYLELFARQSRPGWTTWGNETTKFDRPDISLCAP
jgi:N6-adenosine-specific RNA methylase IME4